MNDPIVVIRGEGASLLGRESFVTIDCQECGQRITDSEAANVIIPRDAQPGDEQSFKIVCLDCDLHRDKKTPT
jgi:hypothetical protein